MPSSSPSSRSPATRRRTSCCAGRSWTTHSPRSTRSPRDGRAGATSSSGSWIGQRAGVHNAAAVLQRRGGHGALREVQAAELRRLRRTPDFVAGHRRRHRRGRRHRRRPVDLRGRLAAGPAVRPHTSAPRSSPTSTARRSTAGRSRSAPTCSAPGRRDRRVDRLRQRRRRSGRAGVRRRLAGRGTGWLGRLPRLAVRRRPAGRPDRRRRLRGGGSGRPGPPSPRRCIARSCSVRATTCARTASVRSCSGCPVASTPRSSP